MEVFSGRNLSARLCFVCGYRHYRFHSGDFNLKKTGQKNNAGQAALLALIMFFIFFFVGEAFLNLFNVDISSFAVAGSFIIFIVALEMILDIEIFKDTPDAPKDATFVPVVFPLIAGAGGADHPALHSCTV